MHPEQGLGAGDPLGFLGGLDRRRLCRCPSYCPAGVAERGPHSQQGAVDDARKGSLGVEEQPYPAPWRAADSGRTGRGARGEAPRRLLSSLGSAVLFLVNHLGHDGLKKELQVKSKHSVVEFPFLKVCVNAELTQNVKMYHPLKCINRMKTRSHESAKQHLLRSW